MDFHINFGFPICIGTSTFPMGRFATNSNSPHILHANHTGQNCNLDKKRMKSNCALPQRKWKSASVLGR